MLTPTGENTEWDAHHAEHGYTDEQVEPLSDALYSAGPIHDEDRDLVARIIPSIPPEEGGRG